MECKPYINFKKGGGWEMAAWEENKECTGRLGTGGSSGPQLWQAGGGGE